MNDEEIEDIELERLDDDDRLKLAIRDKNLFSNFERSEVWERLTEVLTAQIKRLQTEVIMTPMKSLLDLPTFEYQKGEIAALLRIIDTPATLAHEADEVIALFRRKQEDASRSEPDERNDGTDGGDTDD